MVTYQTGLPQEGHAPADPELGGVEQRISIFPTVRGEKIVVRIFDPSNRSFDLGSLGFDDDVLQQFLKLITKPSGLILLTGPTGSGKTTAIYSALYTLVQRPVRPSASPRWKTRWSSACRWWRRRRSTWRRNSLIPSACVP
jgi:type IV pilus assembly protein PilB